MTLKLYAILGAIILALAGSGWLYVRHLQHEAAQAHVAKATTKALDHYITTTHDNQEKADDAVKSVQAAPGADAPVPPDVLAAHRAGLRSLRSHKHPR